MLFENLPYTNFHDLNLDWIINTIKKLTGDEDEQNKAIADIKERLTGVENWVDNFDPDFIRNMVNNFVLRFLEDNLANMIFVEINDAGYVVYYIPDSWEEITFNTTELDISLAIQPEFGHLVLSY